MSQIDPLPSTQPYASPAPFAQPAASGGDATGGIIPYKNPAALIAYYVSIFSLFPFIGFPLGLIAFGLGVKGLIDRSRRPEIKGSVHAWIGIILGGGCAVVWGILSAGLLVALVAG